MSQLPAAPTRKIYGIRNCDTMKKVFAWCDEHGTSYEFHDYKNDKYSCGKVAAAHLLTVAGFHDLATLVKEGEFDEEADEQDKTNMRKNLPKEMWDIFGLKTGMDS